jgi:hypothetical protein
VAIFELFATPSSGHFLNYLQRHLAVFLLFATPSSGHFSNYWQRHLAVNFFNVFAALFSDKGHMLVVRLG